jgi:hypothetical protein
MGELGTGAEARLLDFSKAKTVAMTEADVMAARIYARAICIVPAAKLPFETFFSRARAM